MDVEKIREERNRKIARSLKYFGVIMAIFYLMTGIALVFLPLFGNISETTRYLFACMLIGYGLFRGYRVIKK